ncbi:MAG: hypothetical protein J6X92_01285, partial [Bacteroidales bacterium]|nr:hypothetical protein [Bacteroidales bacterium]
MKKLLILFTFLLLGANLLAQSANDVVYLKNGSVIKGTVSNVTPNETVTIQTSDGSVFVLNMSEVTQIAHEGNTEQNISFPYWANDMMTKKGANLFIGDRELSANDIQEIFSNDMYQTYLGGSSQVKKGNVFLTVGMISLGVTVGLMVAAANTYDESLLTFAQLFTIPADAFTALG